MARGYKSPGFQAYHGRRSSRAGTALKWVVVFLLAVLVVAVAVYFLLQEWLVYDDAGVRVVPPWLQEERGPAGPANPANPAGPTAEQSPQQTVLVIQPEPEPTLRELAAQRLQAVEVTPAVLLSGGAGEQVLAAGANAVLVDLKGEDGMLGYVSGVELAASLGASGSDTAVNRALEKLVEGEAYTVARLSCFRDRKLGNTDACALLSYSGWHWKDFGGVYWACAGRESAQAYMVDICVELAQMGFDEILLTNCGYPPQGSGEMTWIRPGESYPAGELDRVAGPFLARVKAALEPYDVRLSVQALGGELAGESAATGLTADNVAASCDRVWLTQADAAAYDNLSALPGELSGRLVTLLDSPGGGDAAWAVAAEGGG